MKPEKVVYTSGMVFANGDAIELIRDPEHLDHIALAWSNGVDTKIVPEHSFEGELYRPIQWLEDVNVPVRIPDRIAPAEPAERLVNDLARALARYTGLAEAHTTLMTRFVLASWFVQSLPTAPWLRLGGHDEAEGTRLFHLLRSFCRRGLLVLNPRALDLYALPPGLSFLIIQSKNSNELDRILAATRRPGISVLYRRKTVELCAACATFCEDPWPIHDGSRRAIEIPTTVDCSGLPRLTTDGAQKLAAEFQPRLLRYFLSNAKSVRSTEVDVAGLPVPLCELGLSLAMCTPNSRSLQRETIGALKTANDLDLFTNYTDTDCIIIEAMLALCHDKRKEVYVGEVAHTAETILAGRGDPTKLEPRLVGSRLRQLGVKSEPQRTKHGHRYLFRPDLRVLLHRLAYRLYVPTVQVGTMLCPDCHGFEDKNRAEEHLTT